MDPSSTTVVLIGGNIQQGQFEHLTAVVSRARSKRGASFRQKGEALAPTRHP